MKKVVQINTSLHGGAAGIASVLHNELCNNVEFESKLTYGRGKRVATEGYLRFSILPEIYIHGFMTRVFGIEGFGTWLSTKALIKYFVKNKVDLVHLHNLHGYYVNMFSLVNNLKIKAIPVVWTLHDRWSFTGSCANNSGCQKFKDGCGQCPYLPNYPASYYDSSSQMWSLKKMSFSEGWNPVLVTPSRWLKELVAESFLSRLRVEVIPNGIDVNEFNAVDRAVAREKLGISGEASVVLFVASDLSDKNKGLEYLYQALDKLVNIQNITIVTVGKNAKRIAHKTVPQIDFGYVTDNRLLSTIYSASDLFCITSLDEIFGLTVTEAMSCGIPIVGFNVGGVSEQVSLDCGTLVPLRDYLGLAKAINDLLCNDNKRIAMGKSCRQRVVENYTHEVMVGRYLNLYRELLQE